MKRTNIAPARPYTSRVPVRLPAWVKWVKRHRVNLCLVLALVLFLAGAFR